MTMSTRAGAMFESLGGVSNFSEQACTAAPELAEAAADFATADEMVEYINDGIPKALHDKGNVWVRKERGLGKHGLISVKYVSNDFRENPRLNNIEHNALFRIIFMMHQQPETPDPRAKLKFEIVTGVDYRTKGRVNNPRLMPQKSFRKAADKIIDWFKKNEKELLDWETKNESFKSADGKRDVIGTAVVSHGRVSVEVPIYKGDKDYDITSRAVDHLALTDPGKRLYIGKSTEIKRNMLEGDELDEGVRGKVQKLIMDFVQAAGPDAKVSVNSLSRRREFLGIDYGRLMKGYEQLQKAGLIDVETEVGVDTYLTLAEEYLCEGRIGRFFLTAPTLTRKTFFTDMMRHVYALKKGQDDDVLRAALIKADKAIQFWLKAERTAMVTRMGADEVRTYGAELDGIEDRLKKLRKTRTGARAGMRDLYKDVVGLYGF